MALQHVLTTEGNRVEIATNAETGLLLAQTQDFEVVITDLHWQAAGSKGLDSTRGISLVEQLHKARPQVPIVLITAYPTTDTTILAIKRGAYEYVTKPTNFDRFSEAMLYVGWYWLNFNESP